MNRLLRFISLLLRHDTIPPSQENDSGLNVVLDMARERLLWQWSAIDVIDQKSNNLLLLVGAIITILVTLRPEVPSVTDWRNWFFLLALALLLGAGIFALLTYKARNYNVSPTPSAILEYYNHPELTNPQKETIEMLVRVIDTALEENKPIIDRKIRYLNWSHWLLMASLILIVLGYGFSRLAA